MLKIRLMRIGAKKRPFYRVVVVDERAKRTGAYLELLGTYNPITNPHEIKLKQDRIDHWTKNGAQMSDGFLRIIGKAKQRPPRKPKKAKEPSVVSPQSSDNPEKPAEEEKVEEAPAVNDVIVKDLDSSTESSQNNNKKEAEEKPKE